MKRILSFILALALLLSCASALAENPAAAIVDAGEDLFYWTENVTLKGEAAFLLDGVEFKHAEAAYIQDGDRSFWQLDLRTPRPNMPDAGEKKSGYTIIADGMDVYVMEVVFPGVYKTVTTAPQSTILRKSVEMDLMLTMVRNLAKSADAILGEGAITAAENAEGGTDVTFMLDENTPEMVNTALTLLYQYAARRYRNINFDILSNSYMGPISAYSTVTEGILFTTEYMRLKQVDAVVTLDAAEELQSVSGSASVYLQTGGDGQHLLDVTFRLDVSDRGSSTVEPFDPDKYGVVPAQTY